jgi:hypothetical protein
VVPKQRHIKVNETGRLKFELFAHVITAVSPETCTALWLEIQTAVQDMALF